MLLVEKRTRVRRIRMNWGINSVGVLFGIWILLVRKGPEFRMLSALFNFWIYANIPCFHQIWNKNGWAEMHLWQRLELAIQLPARCGWVHAPRSLSNAEAGGSSSTVPGAKGYNYWTQENVFSHLLDSIDLRGGVLKSPGSVWLICFIHMWILHRILFLSSGKKEMWQFLTTMPWFIHLRHGNCTRARNVDLGFEDDWWCILVQVVLAREISRCCNGGENHERFGYMWAEILNLDKGNTNYIYYIVIVNHMQLILWDL